MLLYYLEYCKIEILKQWITRICDMGNIKTNYVKWYEGEEYFWGIEPSELCFELMKLTILKQISSLISFILQELLSRRYH